MGWPWDQPHMFTFPLPPIACCVRTQFFLWPRPASVGRKCHCWGHAENGLNQSSHPFHPEHGSPLEAWAIPLVGVPWCFFCFLLFFFHFRAHTTFTQHFLSCAESITQPESPWCELSTALQCLPEKPRWTLERMLFPARSGRLSRGLVLIVGQNPSASPRCWTNTDLETGFVMVAVCPNSRALSHWPLISNVIHHHHPSWPCPPHPGAGVAVG